MYAGLRNKMRKKLLALLLFCLIIPEIGFCFETPEFLDDVTIRGSYRGKRGLGYHSGYATFGMFYTPDYCAWQPIVDFRAHRIDNGHFASNVGVGLRRQISDCVAYGLNTFYDYRGSHISSRHQWGFGGELFVCDLDFRLNAYLPLGPRHFTSRRTFNYPGNFRARSHLREFTMAHVSFEVGRRMCLFSCFNPYVALGTYYLKSRERGLAYGVNWRVATLIGDYLTVEVRGTYDHIFKNRVQGYVGMDIPIRNLRCCSSCACDCDACLKQPIYRDEMIVFRRRCFWTTNY